jgi:hypothetical protein
MPRGPPIPKPLLRRAFLAVVPNMLQRHRSIASLSVCMLCLFKLSVGVQERCSSVAMGFSLILMVVNDEMRGGSDGSSLLLPGSYMMVVTGRSIVRT